MFFVGMPKLVILMVFAFFLFGVPVMSFLVTLKERRDRQTSKESKETVHKGGHA